MKAIVAIYNPPEFYPPTMNAVSLLAEKMDSITIVTRNIDCKHAAFPANVRVERTGKRMSKDDAMFAGQPAKLAGFVKYLRTLRSLIKKEKPAIWLAYDSIGLYSFYLVGKMAPRPAVFWYHNHDVAEPGAPPRKFSITWWADKYEPKAFSKLHFFSLPAAERLQYFNLNGWQGKYFVIPNYPLKAGGKTSASPPQKSIRLIYQGSISPAHGFEELIPLLGKNINGMPVELTLIGSIAPGYKAALTQQARAHANAHMLHFPDPVPYDELAAITASHHIGLAIHKPKTIIYSTGGTASNKIYEYAAAGLPVILYDNQHYREHLQQMRWAFFTDCTESSIVATIENICNGYSVYSGAAKDDYLAFLNYQAVFAPVMNEVLGSIQTNH